MGLEGLHCSLGDSVLQPSSRLRVDGHATRPPIAIFSLRPATTCCWLASRVLRSTCFSPVSLSPPSSRTFIPQPRKCPFSLPHLHPAPLHPPLAITFLLRHILGLGPMSFLAPFLW